MGRTGSSGGGKCGRTCSGVSGCHWLKSESFVHACALRLINNYIEQMPNMKEDNQHSTLIASRIVDVPGLKVQLDNELMAAYGVYHLPIAGDVTVTCGCGCFLLALTCFDD